MLLHLHCANSKGDSMLRQRQYTERSGTSQLLSIINAEVYSNIAGYYLEVLFKTSHFKSTNKSDNNEYYHMGTLKMEISEILQLF